MVPNVLWMGRWEVEREVYEWFHAQGPDYMQRINRLLREHMESRQAGTLQSQPR